MTAPKTSNRCFISAPSGTNLSGLVSALEARGVVPLETAESISPGSIVDQVLDYIRRADIVVGLLSGSMDDANVLFEIGSAVALRKPVLIIAAKDVQIPTDLRPLPHVYSAGKDWEPVWFALRQLLEPASEIHDEPRPPRRISRPLGDHADHLLRMIGNLKPNATESELYQCVQAILEATGAVMWTAPSLGGTRPDFAIWIDELIPYLGAPLLVEVKREVLTASAFRALHDQILSYVAKSGGKAVLVLVRELGAVESRFSRILGTLPFTFVFQIDDFIRKLREESIGSVLRDARNARVHGSR